ncbi:PH domain-containing protein [Thalassobacillus hwangdonensis]|uniref:PH domain-containing protein n=1 Tax=Thalassobacillus hwangdonensis TaxID=546108 RepID=UPI0036DD8BB7
MAVDPAEGWIGLFIIGLIEIVMLWALIQSYHEVTEQAFITRFGPIKKAILLRDIREVTYTYNPIASPSWTFKRLKVTDKDHRHILTSAPKDADALRTILKERCKQANIDV